MSTIPQAQIQSLADAASTLAQRLAETPATASFQADIAGLEVPMASLLDLADLVREGIVAPLQALLATGTDPDLASLQDALSRAPLAINLSSTLDGSTDHGIQWFEITLHGDQISQSVVLTPEVPDGMQMDAITTELSAGLEGLFRIGIDLTPGLTPDQAVLVDTRQLEACAHIDSTVDDIPASWGSYALGTGSAAIRLDACISLNPPGGSSTWALGQLATLDIDQLFASTTSGDGFSIQLPFTLDMAGFSLPQGSVLSLELSTPSAFDPSALALTWPAITLEDGSPFDFSLLGSFSQSDFTGFLQQLAGLLRSLGDQLELPVIGTDLGDVLNLGLDIDNLLSALKNPDGSWRFNSLQELFGQMGDALGLPAGSLDLRWNPQQASLEWTLDYTRNTSASTPFDGSRFLPADSGMTMDAQGSASIDTSLNYHISGGIVASTGATALDSSTLLADLNQGGGIHRGLLDSAGQTDISFILANGSSISLDLDAAAAMTTLGDLLAWLNSASPLLQAALVDSALVLTDHSTGTATFSVQSPSAGGIQSMLPLSLGLWGASASSSGGGQSITGQILGQTPSYARFYLDTAAPLVEGSVTVEARVDGGLAAGPLTLAIDHGAMQASTQWSAGFNPYQDGDSSLLSFADLPAADPAALLAQSFSATRVEGYLQLRTSDALNAPLAINPADYSADPLTTPPDTSLVPFIQISLDENADDSSWAWQTGPSEKLASLFDQSLASFSWQDVPALLEQLFAGLEQTPLWDIPLPMTSMTLGDLIDLRGALGGLTLPDLADSLGSIDFAGLHARLEDGLQLALPSLNTGFPDLVPRFMGLLDSLEALSFSWDTITPGDPDLEAAFLSRLGAWTLNAQGLFDELSLASLNPSLTTFAGLLDTELQSLGSLSFSLEGLLDLLENALTLEVPGLIFEVNPRMDTSGAESLLLFDFYYGPDPAHPEVFTPITAPVSLAARELQGSPIQISSEGELAISVQPTLEATVAMHLGSRQVTVDSDSLRISLDLSQQDENLLLEASLGGMASISVGGDDPGQRYASLRLSDSEGSSAPAHFGYNESGDGSLTGSAFYAADLPLYATGPTATATAPFAVEALLAITGGEASFDPVLTLPTAAEIQDLLSAGVLDFSLWSLGAVHFIDSLIDLLGAQMLDQLPVLGDIDLGSADSLLGQLKALFETLADCSTPFELAGTLQTGLGDLFADTDIQPVIDFRLDGSVLDMSSSTPANNLDWNQFLTGSQQFVIGLELQKTDASRLDADSLDLDLDGLGISVEGDAGIDLAMQYGMNLGFGFSRDKGFFVNGDSGQEVTLNVGAGFVPGTELAMNLGLMKFTLSDNTPGEISDHASREFDATLGLDLGTGAIAVSSGLPENISVEAEIRAKLDVALGIDILDAAGPEIGVDLIAGLFDDTPVSTAPGEDSITLSYSPTRGGLDLAALDSQLFHFALTDTWMDLSVLLGDPIRELAAMLGDAMEPIEPILDILRSEVPLISDVSEQVGGGQITMLDAISWFGDGADSVQTLLDLLDTLDSLQELASTGVYHMGSLSPAEGALGLFTGSSHQDAGDFSQQAYTGGDNPDNEISAAQDTASGLRFPIIDDPAGNLFNLMFGKPADLVYWDIPDLEAGFDFRQSFPILPPLYVTLFGGINFRTNFDMGYDSRGLIQLFNDAITPSDIASALLDGLYLDDSHVLSGKTDTELAVEAVIGAGAELNVVVAKAGVEGGVEGTIGADLNDPDDNGKVYTDEISLDPLCLFDFSGSLDIFLAAYIKVGIDTPFGFVTLYKDRFNLADVNLLDWTAVTCPPEKPPELAEEQTIDGQQVLVLNIGDRAHYIDETFSDGNEVYVVDVARDEQGNPISGSITLSTRNLTQTLAIEDITAIRFDAGIGNDTVVITPGITLNVIGHGGDGNDNLTGGSGRNTFYGDAGSDLLNGRGAADSLIGGDGDDYLYGFGGNDTLDGGAGNDALYGDDDLGDLTAFNLANPDFAAGSAGNDRLTGGSEDDVIVAGEGSDQVYGDEGDDQILAGHGNDSVEGGAGNDRILGEDGNDDLWGDDADGLISGGDADTHADRIEGGSGYNRLYGGTGNDLLYAWDASLLESAPVSEVHKNPVSGILWSSEMAGGDGADVIYGTQGNDWLDGGNNGDYIKSGQGKDVLLGGNGNDALLAYEGDGIAATGGNSLIYGGFGDDVIDAGSGNNWIEGGVGDDAIFARKGADTVYGGTTDEKKIMAPDASVYQSGLDLGLAALAASSSPAFSQGGFSATPASGGAGCGADLHYQAEPEPENLQPLHAVVFKDDNANGQRDDGEALMSAENQWTVVVIDTDPDDEDAMISQQTLQGGDLLLPQDGLPEGGYRIILMPENLPGGPWINTTDIAMDTRLTADGQDFVPAFGFSQQGSIIGQVTAKTSEGNTLPYAGVRVFLDSNGDGHYQEGESQTRSIQNGSYSFTGLMPGQYSVAVEESDACVRLPQAKTVTLSSGEKERADFAMNYTLTPVVEGVVFGSLKPGSAPLWVEGADGAAQLTQTLASQQVNRIGIELCSNAGIDSGKASVQLYQLVNGQQQAVAIARMNFQDDYLEYSISGSASTPSAGLAAGSYLLRVNAAGIVDDHGQSLDGDWVTGISTFDSGDGKAGGNFEYRFNISDTSSSSTRMAAVATSTTTAQASIHGRISYPGDSSSDPALARGADGIPLTLRNADGDVIAETVSAAEDVNGNGSLEWNEHGLFHFEGLEAGRYTVTTDADHALTSGVTLASDTWLAATANADTKHSIILGLDMAEGKVTQLAEYPDMVIRDITLVSPHLGFVSGSTARGEQGLWQILPDRNDALSAMAAPQSAIIALDTLDENHLLAMLADGQLATYSISHNSWNVAGYLQTSQGDSGKYYPVGDIAIVSPREAYAIISTRQPYTGTDTSASQQLVHFDPRTLNILDSADLNLKQTALIGLETAPDGSLIALGSDETLYTLDRASLTLTPMAMQGLGDKPYQLGGLTRARAESVSDPGNATPTITLTLDEDDQVNIQVGIDETAELTWEDGHDSIDGGCGDEADQLFGDDGTLLPGLTSVGGNDFIRGRGGNDLISGGLKGDQLLGEDGNDTLSGGSNGANRLDGGDGDDLVTGGDRNDLLLGGEGQDQLLGGLGADWLFGQGGSDRLQGEAGNDLLQGGAGADLMEGGADDDSVIAFNDALGGDYALAIQLKDEDTFTGSSGTDRIIASADTAIVLGNNSLSASGGSVLKLTDAIEQAALTGGAGNNRLDASGFNGNVTLSGLAGHDTLLGGKGNDVLMGGSGNDDLAGGQGDDHYLIDTQAGDQLVRENAAGGSDHIDLSSSRANLNVQIGQAPITGYLRVTSLDGLHLEALNGQVEQLTLGSGNDQLAVMAGILSGVTIHASGGEDSLNYSGSYTSSPWLTDVSVDLAAGSATGLAGISGIENLYGGQGHDLLKGDAQDNQIDGMEGNDTLQGLAGDDYLLGGSGNDQLLGGADNDLLSGQTGSNQLTGGEGDDVYAFLAGSQNNSASEIWIPGAKQLDTLDFGYVGSPITIDIAHSAATKISVSYDLATTEAGRLNAFESIRGGSSTDRFVMGDGITFSGQLAGGGIPAFDFKFLDILDYSHWTSAVSIDYRAVRSAADSGQATGTVSVTGLTHIIGGSRNDSFQGGDFPVWFEGGAGQDSLSGSSQNDQLAGGDGNDALDGRSGADRLSGGRGDDRYVVDDGGDSIVELAASGTDSVTSSVSLTLWDHVENATLTGSVPLSLTGNSLANVLTGNDGSNRLEGLGGGDQLSGGRGSDSLSASGDGNRLTGGLDSDRFILTGLGTGHTNTITDLSGGESLQLSDLNMIAPLHEGKGLKLMAGEIEYRVAAGKTWLTLGLDALPGADSAVVLEGFTTPERLMVHGNRLSVNQAPSGGLSITGSPLVGNTLRVSQTLDDADGMGTLSYLWRANGLPIKGATGKQYVVTADDAGKAISVTASYTDADGFSESRTSAPLRPIGAVRKIFAIDGYLAHARVWLDANGNQLLDAGEPVTLTDASGAFEAFDSMDGILHVDANPEGGSVDLSTGSAFSGAYTAPASASVITPLTTLLVAAGEALPDLPAEAVEQQVKALLGIDADVDLTHYDPLLAAASDNEGAIIQAIEVQAAASQVANLLDLATALTAPENITPLDISQNVAAQLVRTGLAQGSLALDDPSVISSTLEKAVTTLSADILDRVASAAALLNQTISQVASDAQSSPSDGASSLALIVATQIVTRNDLASQALQGEVTLDENTVADTLAAATSEVSQLFVAVEGVTMINHAATGELLIEGIEEEGQTLSVSAQLADVDGLGPLHFQWLRDGSPIHGASGLAYLLNQDDVGHRISVATSYTDRLGYDNLFSGSSTGPIANLNAPVSGSVSISGFAGVGQTLSIAAAMADGDGLGALSCQWYADGAAISNATATSFAVTAAEAGKVISVTVSFTDGYGTEESLSAEATAAVLAPLAGASARTDRLTGTEDSDYLTGDAGNDQLQGLAGADCLDGGTGSDQLSGGSGDDIYIVDNRSDRVMENIQGKSQQDAGGTDTVISSVSWTLGSFVEHLVLTGSSRLDGSGNTLDNRMTGNSARNVLDGKAGLDSMDGMEGGDVYLITSASDHTQAEISDSGSDGVDELRFAATKAQTLKLFAADTGLERIIIGTGSKDSAVTTGTTALNMDASEAGNALELTGNAGKNQLTGTAFNDVITGGKGGDILSGGKGADTFSFRSGDSSGSGTGKMDSLLDFTPGEDIIHFSSALSAVSSNDAASARMAALDGLTGIASFAEGSGLTLKDALADIGSAFKASGDKAGLFSLFQLDQQGDFYLLVSDGKSGIGSNDTVIRLVGVDSLQGYQLLNGDLLLTG